MFGKFLCMLSLHDWQGGSRFYPDFYARIITRFETRFECSRCGKVEESISTYDEVTGALLENTHNGVAI